jgi:hypothetical protein
MKNMMKNMTVYAVRRVREQVRQQHAGQHSTTRRHGGGCTTEQCRNQLRLTQYTHELVSSLLAHLSSFPDRYCPTSPNPTELPPPRAEACAVLARSTNSTLRCCRLMSPSTTLWPQRRCGAARPATALRPPCCASAPCRRPPCLSRRRLAPTCSLRWRRTARRARAGFPHARRLREETEWGQESVQAAATAASAR